ncbi:UNVERIFIED_CONTAM: hypothetical protein BEN50_02505 [Euhalothece sp. KZN 001]
MLHIVGFALPTLSHFSLAKVCVSQGSYQLPVISDQLQKMAKIDQDFFEQNSLHEGIVSN